jgi:hypothetical protein
MSGVGIGIRWRVSEAKGFHHGVADRRRLLFRDDTDKRSANMTSLNSALWVPPPYPPPLRFAARDELTSNVTLQRVYPGFALPMLRIAVNLYAMSGRV